MRYRRSRSTRSKKRLSPGIENLIVILVLALCLLAAVALFSSIGDYELPWLQTEEESIETEKPSTDTMFPEDSGSDTDSEDNDADGSGDSNDGIGDMSDIPTVSMDSPFIEFNDR